MIRPIPQLLFHRGADAVRPRSLEPIDQLDQPAPERAVSEESSRILVRGALRRVIYLGLDISTT